MPALRRPVALAALTLGLLTAALPGQPASGPAPTTPPAPNSSEAPARLYAFWGADQAELNPKGGLLLRDRLGDTLIDALTSLTVVTDPVKGRVLEFDGTQIAPARLRGRIPQRLGTYCSLDLFPTGEGAREQTVVYAFGFFELRYKSRLNRLVLIVWAVSNRVFSEIEIDIPPNEWSHVVAAIETDTFSLSVNERVVSAPLPPFTNPQKEAALILGFGGTDRAFRGRFNRLALAGVR